MLFLDEAIKERRSIRNFAKKDVKAEDIISVINAGCAAPSAKNTQPWTFIVLDKGQKKSIADSMRAWSSSHKSTDSSVAASADIVEDAPVAIAVCTPDKKKYPSSIYISIGACLENMSLKAVDIGLGSLIVCDVWCVDKLVREIISTECEITALFLLGYAGNTIRSERVRKPIEKVLKGLSAVENSSRSYDELPEATIGNNNFVFISYSHNDADIVIKDITELKRHGVVLWYDRSIAYGEKWDTHALQAVSNSKCAGVSVYVSHSSVRSPAVLEELKKARENNKQIVAVHIGDLPLNAYADGTMRERLYTLLNEKDKFISRSDVPSVCNCIEQITNKCLEWGAVRKSGVYDDFEYEMLSDGIKIVSYNGTSEKVVIPTRIASEPITVIGANAVCSNSNIKKIILPSTVKKICAGAFADNVNLESIDLPNGITYIGDAAFRDCISITEIKLPPDITVLSEALFRGCRSLKRCAVPYGVVELEEAVFNGCESLVSVTLPETVKKMTEGGFYGCKNLRNLVIPENIEGLEIQSFETCPLITVKAGGFEYINGKGSPI